MCGMVNKNLDSLSDEQSDISYKASRKISATFIFINLPANNK
jgi:hypothetical protein